MKKTRRELLAEQSRLWTPQCRSCKTARGTRARRPVGCGSEAARRSDFFTPPPKGGRGAAVYHPAPAGCASTAVTRSWPRASRFSDVVSFEKETNRMPNFMLHELAHGYHDLVLTFG